MIGALKLNVLLKSSSCNNITQIETFVIEIWVCLMHQCLVLCGLPDAVSCHVILCTLYCMTPCVVCPPLSCDKFPAYAPCSIFCALCPVFCTICTVPCILYPVSCAPSPVPCVLGPESCVLPIMRCVFVPYVYGCVGYLLWPVPRLLSCTCALYFPCFLGPASCILLENVCCGSIPGDFCIASLGIPSCNVAMDPWASIDAMSRMLSWLGTLMQETLTTQARYMATGHT